ncbi:MAG: FAD-binding protein [Firmicutes bacterium]|jgi:succinate dehydrogenase/fumarate reductase flavoprotein subunit|nr:FAD-binding protein [Bacillota bacterium]
MTSPVDVVTVDVAVVGAGGAGLRAALEAARSGARVAMIVKGRVGQSGTTAYHVAETAGFAAADGYCDPMDSPDVHLGDIVEAGCGMCDVRLARILAYESPKQIPFLEKLGVVFITNSDGRHAVVKGCFGSRPRNRKILGHGVPIVQALGAEVRRAGVYAIENTGAVELLVDDGRCTGVVCASAEGKVSVVKAAATVLATGGAGQLYAQNLNPPDITGDGYALGFRAGAQLINMEFMQAGFGITSPVRNMVMTWLWLLNPNIRTRDGRDVLGQYLPAGVSANACMAAKSKHYPFTSRDDSKYLEIAVQDQYRKANGSLQSECYLDFSHIKSIDSSVNDHDLRAMLTITHEWMLKRGLDILRQPVPVTCFAHAINGGLRIDENAETTLPGLYAAGEVAGGPHGADRLGGTMFAASQVFGARAGRAAAGRAAGQVLDLSLSYRERRQVDEVLGTISDLRGRAAGVQADELRRDLQRTMSLNSLVCRTRKSLIKAAESVACLKTVSQTGLRVGPGGDVLDAVGIRNLLQVAEIVLGSALRREESRGSHYRADFPERDRRYDWVTAVTRAGDGPEYSSIKL